MIKLLTFEKFDFKDNQQEDRYKPILDKITNAKVGDILSNDVVYMYVQYLTDNAGKYEECFGDSEADLGERLDQYDKYILKEIPIDKIDTEEWGFDMDDVQEYMKMYSNTKEYPPIVVSKNYSIIDGTHRANALKLCGLKKILAFVGYDGVNESVNEDDPYDEEIWEEEATPLMIEYKRLIEEMGFKTQPIRVYGDLDPQIIFTFEYEHHGFYDKFTMIQFGKAQVFLFRIGDNNDAKYVELYGCSVDSINKAIKDLYDQTRSIKKFEQFNTEDPYNEENWNEVELTIKNFHDLLLDAKIFKSIKYHKNEEEYNNDELIEFKCDYPGRGTLDFVLTRIDDSGDHDFNGPGIYMILNQTGDSFKLIECSLGELIDAVSGLAEKLKRDTNEVIGFDYQILNKVGK